MLYDAGSRTRVSKRVCLRVMGAVVVFQNMGNGRTLRGPLRNDTNSLTGVFPVMLVLIIRV